jgi:tRNA A64-2'-O-ribosylphosphate transferase
LLTNSRAGDWYFDPKWEGYENRCYFKSTDGHYGNYGFSRRRLGLGVLKKLKECEKWVRGTYYHGILLIRDRRTILILDSTRRGKKFPDSFTKTVRASGMSSEIF